MKIGLIQAPCWSIMYPPYGISVLSSYIRSKGHHVYVRDLNIELFHEAKPSFRDKWTPENHLFWIDDLNVSNYISENESLIDSKVNEILNEGVDIIGLSMHFSSEYMSREIARRIKEKNKNIIIVMGGPQASRIYKGHELAAQPYVDFVVQGEGELVFEDIIERAEKGITIDYCEGAIIHRNGSIKDCGNRNLIRDLNGLPFADFSDFKYFLYKEPFRLPVSFSRGCISHCIYCNEKPYWKIFRFRKAEIIFKEIKYQMEKIGGINYIDFQDSLINGHINELEKLCDLIISDGLKIRWGGQAVIRKEMNFALLSKMKKAGCICLNYDLETASQKMLKKIGKSLSVGVDIDAIIRETHNAGIDCILNFMFGFPDETEEDFKMSMDFIERNRKFIDLINPSPGFCAFDKGSYAYNHADEFDIKIEESNGALWETSDGLNNYPFRLNRFERFLEHTNHLGIRNNYPGDKLIGREAVLGYYYFYKKDWGKAIFYYKSALNIEPDNESYLVKLGKAYISNNMKEDGLKCLKKVLDLRENSHNLAGVRNLKEEMAGMGFDLNESNAEQVNLQKIISPIINSISRKRISAYRVYDNQKMPKELHIELTYQCNSRCRMCDLWCYYERNNMKPSDEITKEDIERIASSSVLKDVNIVVLSGGEPFLRQDLIEICQILRDKLPQAVFNILTNALDTDNILERIYELTKKVNINKLCIGSSLDGIGENHDKIRGIKGAYDKTMATMSYIKKIKDVECFFNFTITPENYDQLYPVYKISQDMGIQFSAQFVVNKAGYYSAQWSEDRLLEIERVITHKILPELLNGRKDLSSMKILKYDTGLLTQLIYWSHLVQYQRYPKKILPVCGAGCRFIMIDPLGNAFFCSILKNKIIGNIKKDNLDKIWYSDNANAIRNYILSGACNCWLICIIAPAMEEILSYIRK